MVNITAESDHESTESDEEFQICEICSTEEVIAFGLWIGSMFIIILKHWLLLQDKRKLLHCSCCSQLVHPTCLVPPLMDLVPEWSCHSCKEKTDEYLQARHAYVAELLKRFCSNVKILKFSFLDCHCFSLIKIEKKQFNLLQMNGQVWSSQRAQS